MFASTFRNAQEVAGGPSPSQGQDSKFNIGAVLNPPEGIQYFEEAISDAMATYDISLVAKTVHMNLNPIRMAENVCEELISQKG